MIDYNDDSKVTFNQKKNPKRDGSKAHARFARYMSAKNVAEYFKLGGSVADLKYDFDKSFIEVEGNSRSEK